MSSTARATDKAPRRTSPGPEASELDDRTLSLVNDVRAAAQKANLKEADPHQLATLLKEAGRIAEPNAIKVALARAGAIARDGKFAL